MSTIGIDFGTTNSVAAIYGTHPEIISIGEPRDSEWSELGMDKVMPTIMGVLPDGSLKFGWAAKLDPRLDSGERRIEAIKRLFADEETIYVDGQAMMVEEIATMIFAEIRQSVTRQGISPDRAVVTVPANSRALARLRTRLTAGMSGLHVLALINEPTAAAMAFAEKAPFEQRILVVDWGGGTLDVTVLQSDSGVFVEQASAGIARNGGLDFDKRIAQQIAKTIPGHENWSAAERSAFRLNIEAAKIRLSTATSTNIVYPGGSYYLTRTEFERWVNPIIQEVRQPLERVFADIKSTADSIDSVVLVGGTGRIPAVREFISNFLNKAPAEGVDPLTAVAEGASIAAAIMTGEAPDRGFFVSTEHALGTYAIKDTTGVPVFSPIIPRNHKLPAAGSEQYVPAHPESTQVNLSIVEGDEAGLPESDPSNTDFCSFPVKIPEGDTPEQRGIEVRYEYDVNGIIHVTVTHTATGNVLVQERVAPGMGAGSLNDKAELASISARAKQAIDDQSLSRREIKSNAEFSQEHAELLNRAKTAVIPFLTDRDARQLRTLVEELEDCPQNNRDEVADRLRVALEPHSYLW